MEGLGLHMIIILKWMLGNMDVKLWTELVCYRMGGLFEYGNEPLAVMKT